MLCVPRVCTNYRMTFFFFFSSCEVQLFDFFLFWQTFSLLCSKHTLGSYSTLIKKNLGISWSAQILFLICFIKTTWGKTEQYLNSGLGGDGVIAIRHQQLRVFYLQRPLTIFASCCCIWRPRTRGVNPRTAIYLVVSGTGIFWGDTSLEAGESTRSKVLLACSRSQCKTPGDHVDAAHLTPSHKASLAQDSI